LDTGRKDYFPDSTKLENKSTQDLSPRVCYHFFMSVEKKLTSAVREGLKRKVEEHNESVGAASTKRTNLRTLGTVFNRGVGAYNTNPGSVRPSVRSPEQWAYARVNSFLYVLRNGKFRSGKHDTDLLPKGHPMSTKSVAKASYKPTQGMVSAARRGLKLREEQPPSRRGGTPVGLARARDIINGKELSASTVLRMHSFFARHAVDAQAQGFRPGEDGYPSKGLQAHLLWGGNPGKSWSKKIRDQIMRDRKKEMEDDIEKAEGAMNHLLMAYAEMMEYRFEGAHELRADTMEIIHALEHSITGDDNGEGIETAYMDDEEEKEYMDDDYNKEIVMEDGQYCVRSKDGSRNFGCYISREAAEDRLAQIESFSQKIASLDNKPLVAAYNVMLKSFEDQPKYQVFVLTGEELNKRYEHPVFYAREEVEEDLPLATIVKAEKRYTMGPVYVPGLEDAHGETIEANELQESIWDWVRKEDRRIYLQHSDKVAGEMVEILTWPAPIETSLIVPGEGVTKYSFPENTPFMGVIWSDWAWDLVKSGKLRGYSIGGQAQRIEVDLAAESTL
jgi:hypothetical protein